jgi:hypothetical protein
MNVEEWSWRVDSEHSPEAIARMAGGEAEQDAVSRKVDAPADFE